jgi:soluble lytic murein transglycosylase-like protein
MPFSMDALNQKLSGLATNPLFNLGLGMLSTPYQRTPVSFGQVLGNGVSQMDYAQAQAAKQQQAQMQAQLLQQRVTDAKTQAAAQQAKKAARAKYVASLGPNASPDETYLASTDPATLAAQRYKAANVNPWTLPKGATGEVNLRSGEVRPLTIPGVNAPVGQSPATGGLPAGLPPETQAYVPKVMAALGGAPAFQNGQPTPQLLDAVQHVESGGNPNAVSPAGAQGPYQFMPATAASVGVTNPFDPVQARQGAARYLTQLDQRFGNPQAAIAAYNAGPGRVQTALGAPTIPMAMQQRVAQVLYGNKTASTAKLPTGYEWNADHTAAMPIPGTKAAASAQGAASAALFGDPTQTGPAYLQSIPKGNQDIVKGLLDGTVSLPPGTTLKSPLWQSALASVKHADPSWNQAAFKQYADTRKWATTGQGGQLINNINTASYHLDKLREDIDALHNGNYTLLNRVGNAISQGTGGQAVTNFNADLTPVASELAAVYKGKGVPSDAEISHFMTALTPNMSHGQQMNVIRGWIGLLAGKLNSTREQYQSGMSKLSSPISVINPHAAEALERITTMANRVSNTGQHAMPAQDTSPIYAPGGETQSANAPQQARDAAQQPPASGWSIQQVQ